MQRRGKQSKIYRTEVLQMLMCRNDQSRLKFTDSKYCRCQYAEIGSQIQIIKTEILKIPISRDKASKVKYEEVKYCTDKYAETR